MLKIKNKLKIIHIKNNYINRLSRKIACLIVVNITELHDKLLI